MENKKDSYIVLISNLCLLLGFSYIIYAVFFGIESIGKESFHLFNISNYMAVNIGIIEILFCVLLAYILHKCNKKNIRYITIVICLLNIGYRVLNILIVTNIFNVFILVMSIILLLNLLFYKKDKRN